MNSTILVVDSRPSVTAAACQSLRDAGYSTVTAHNFHEALGLLTSLEPAVLITSLELGLYNGLHLLVRSSIQTPSTRVVVIGPDSPAVEGEAVSLGAAVYLPRPVSLTDLVGRVEPLVAAGGCESAPPVLGPAHVARFA